MENDDAMPDRGQVINLRILQTVLSKEQPVVVTTASQLRTEITKGTAHIEIRQHLDLSTLSHLLLSGRRSGGDGSGMLPASIQSIRGNCNGSGPDYDELGINDSQQQLELLPWQCMLVTNGDLLALAGTLWLDRVFIRLRRPATDPRPPGDIRTLVSVTGDTPGMLYITNSTLQGDSGSPSGELGTSRAMAIYGKAYAEGCTFANFVGAGAAASPVTLLRVGSSASFVSCTFQDNMISAREGALIKAIAGSAVRLETCAFTGNAGAGFILMNPDGQAAFFSDPESIADLTLPYEIEDSVTMLPLNSEPDEVFLSGDDTWLLDAEQAANVNRVHTSPPGTSEPPALGSGTDGRAIAGIVAAAVAALALMIICLTCWHHRQRGKEGWGPESKEMRDISERAIAAVAGAMERERRGGADSAYFCSGGWSSRSLQGAARGQRPRISPRVSINMSPLISPRLPLSSRIKTLPLERPGIGTLIEADALHTLSMAPQEPLPPLGEGTSTRERLTYIGRQLDSFGRHDMILKKYQVLGEGERRGGGQAVVQFVLSPQSNTQYAIKFFANRSAYNDEKQLYLTSELSHFMPTVMEFHDNESGDFRDPFNNPMPPCFVMEKGESLADRTKRCKHDIFTTIQIIGQVAKCLADLHARGWVHRDLKPANIMFLTRSDTWTLIDFGLAWRIGKASSVGYTLAYAAPEVITAKVAGVKRIVADSAVDAWALGVMAFELLTSEPAFNMFHMSLVEVWEQLQGLKPLPWEGARLTPVVRKQLGKLRGPVLQMLNRDPTQRMTCREFWQALHDVFTAHSSTQEHEHQRDRFIDYR